MIEELLRLLYCVVALPFIHSGGNKDFQFREIRLFVAIKSNQMNNKLKPFPITPVCMLVVSVVHYIHKANI